MWFSIFATVLILAIAFYEGLYGLFTGLINCILAVISVALAFGLYEDLYQAQLKAYQPDHGRAIALLSIFIISLLVLRTVFDMLIKGNLQFPVYLDRVGGGLFGFINGMLIVGMLSIGFQMLPFGETVMGFGRFTLIDKDTNQPPTPEDFNKKDLAQFKYRRNEQLLRQDTFTMALASNLSSNALAGETRLADIYPDYLASMYHAVARIGDKDTTTVEDKQTIDVTGYWTIQPNEFFARQHKDKDNFKKISLARAEPPASGHKRIVIRMKASGGTAANLQFSREQARLVIHDAGTDRSTEYLPVGINDDNKAAGNKWVEAYDAEYFARPINQGAAEVDFVFEIPESANLGEGSFFEFKQNARLELTGKDKSGKNRPNLIGKSGRASNTPPSNQEDADPGSSSTGDAANPRTRISDATRRTDQANASNNQDRVSGIGPARADSIVTEMLPFTLTEYTGEAEIAGGNFKGGHLIAPLNTKWEPVQGTRPPVERFDIPSDMRLMQISVEKLNPQSWLGQAWGFAADSLNNFYLVDTKGEKHLPVGVLAMAKVAGVPTMEIIFLDETARQGDAVMGRVTPLERIKKNNLTREYSLFYLFQVKPGTRAEKLKAGRQDVDLRHLNLEAN